MSNHGARQLDRVPAPVDVLEEVAGGGRMAGPRSGSTAGSGAGSTSPSRSPSGARGVLVGRPILWALAAGGQPGVERALAILREEFEIALALLGTPTPADVTRASVLAPGS